MSVKSEPWFWIHFQGLLLVKKWLIHQSDRQAFLNAGQKEEKEEVLSFDKIYQIYAQWIQVKQLGLILVQNCMQIFWVD